MNWSEVLLGTLVLLKLTGPDHQLIYISPQHIVSVRPPRHTDAFGPGVKCLLHTDDGKYVAVIEPCNSFVVTVEPDKPP